jgi:hypothetical protein
MNFFNLFNKRLVKRLDLHNLEKQFVLSLEFLKIDEHSSIDDCYVLQFSTPLAKTTNDELESKIEKELEKIFCCQIILVIWDTVENAFKTIKESK